MEHPERACGVQPAAGHAWFNVPTRTVSPGRFEFLLRRKTLSEDHQLPALLGGQALSESFLSLGEFYLRCCDFELVNLKRGLGEPAPHHTKSDLVIR